ncbi:MerR family transcriptional regulator [Leifsonia poae]|uniref:MerR family transcriptional regulator n=1 Tax=Leifsonia poae TaxID=110933 RepID=UPI001CBF2804|nr:MerR family transcriptional regulator [Leifsonia poae]
MQISELAERAGVTVKAVRYYESLGLVVPERLPNGYREYSDDHLRAVAEIRKLAASGIAPSRATPFIECLDTGHEHSDECPASLAAYRAGIAELDRTIAELTARRDLLAGRLDESASRGFPTAPPEPTRPADFTRLPSNLPRPHDDGAADHLPGLPIPPLALPTSDGGRIDLARLGRGRTIVYLYPLTGRPGVDLPDGWDAIPGARGCSTEACDFRDQYDDLRAAGVDAVYGFSSQQVDYQHEVVERLQLPFPMISDERHELADALSLPTFEAGGMRLYSRLTLVLREGTIEHAFYPIFPPNTHAQQVLRWLSAHPL